MSRLGDLDHKHLWHPFTQMADWLREEPLVIERAEGCWLFDTEGHRYLDGVSSLWCNVHGHRRAEIDQAIAEQLGKVAHTTMLGLSSPPAIELGAALAARAPAGLTRVFYSDSGSTAVEVALKMAFQYWQIRGETNRTKFLILDGAYHGDTIGSVSLGGIDLFHQTYRPLLFPTVRVPNPYCYRCPLEKSYPSCDVACIDPVAAALAEHGRSLAAAVIEPLVQGASGMIMQPPGYLKSFAHFCRKEGVLLICDEVATGFGRTGTLFACEQEDVRPDILCLAKGITAGYMPLAATMTTEAIFEVFLARYEDFKTFFHGHTYTGNPLACAAALASLSLFDDPSTLENVRLRAEQLAALLEPLRGNRHVGEIRQQGLMVGIELVRDRATRERFDPASRMGHRIILAARARGVLLRPLGDVVVLMPPLAIGDDEIALLARVTRESIEEVLPS